MMFDVMGYMQQIQVDINTHSTYTYSTRIQLQLTSTTYIHLSTHGLTWPGFLSLVVYYTMHFIMHVCMVMRSSSAYNNVGSHFALCSA